MSYDVLSEAAIAASLSRPVSVRVYEQLDSTNTEVKRLSVAGNRQDKLLLAEQQTAGRGRLGRRFWSPEGSGLYMTLALHSVIDYADALLLTTMAAAAVVDAVETLTPLRPQIKWVNDVYLDGKKACGILTETLTDPETGRLAGVMIGIGINVREAAYPPEIADIATHLDIGEVSRNRLAAEILNRIYAYLDDLPTRTFLMSYREHSLVLGRPITVLGKDGEKTGVTGIAMEIDDDGGLLVRTADGGMCRLGSGEISVRLTE